MSKSPTISFRVPPLMLDALRAIASEERRTVGAVIRLLLEKRLAQLEKERSNA